MNGGKRLGGGKEIQMSAQSRPWGGRKKITVPGLEKRYDKLCKRRGGTAAKGEHRTCRRKAGRKKVYRKGRGETELRIPPGGEGGAREWKGWIVPLGGDLRGKLDSS